MASIKKISIISGIFIVIVSIFSIFGADNLVGSSLDDKIILQQIKFDAVYLEDEKVVLISFEDNGWTEYSKYDNKIPPFNRLNEYYY